MMSWLVWPAWVQIPAGAFGTAWALSILAALRKRGPRHPHDPLNAWGLLIISVALAGAGLFRLLS